MYKADVTISISVRLFSLEALRVETIGAALLVSRRSQETRSMLADD
jgi:hypothetical protein